MSVRLYSGDGSRPEPDTQFLRGTAECRTLTAAGLLELERQASIGASLKDAAKALGIGPDRLRQLRTYEGLVTEAWARGMQLRSSTPKLVAAEPQPQPDPEPEDLTPEALAAEIKQKRDVLESVLRGWVAATNHDTHHVLSCLWASFDRNDVLRDHVVRVLSNRRGVQSVALAALGRSRCDYGRARMKIMAMRDGAMLRSIATNYLDGFFGATEREDNAK